MSHTIQSKTVMSRRIIVVVLTAMLLWAGAPIPSAQAAVGVRVDLRVLLFRNGGTQTAAFATLMDREGVPYTEVDLTDPGRPVIDEAFLADTATGHGYFQAVVAPDQWVTTLSPAEVDALFTYERTYGVRQVNAYAFPGESTGQTEPSYNGSLDGAAASVTSQGLAGPFSYLTGSFTIDDFAEDVLEVHGNIAQVAPTLPAGATFTPLVNATVGEETGPIIGVYAHDFREQLSINAVYNSDQQWFNTIGHGVLTWMTRGIHLGYQRNYLNVQVDDVFLPDDRWSSSLNCTPGDTPTLCIDPTATDIRMTAADVTRLVHWQNANDFTMDMVFNAHGSDYAIQQAEGPDPLTDAFLAAKDEFTWVNHTYTHTFLGCIQIAPTVLGGPWHCAEPGETGPYYDDSAVAHEVILDTAPFGPVRWLKQAKIASEITLNHEWAVAKALPNYDPHALVTGEHAGLLTTPQQPIDNPELAPALEAAGITHTASDASREPQSRAVQGGTTVTVPRYPMNIFYNAGTYGDEVDEYNWIYTSEADGGSGICEEFPDTTTCIDELPNANPAQAEESFRDFIVPIEVRNAYRRVITNDPRPFYAHQSNLAEDGILYPVVEGILDEYRSTHDAAKSPIVTEGLVSLGQALNRMTAWTGAQDEVTAYIDASGVHVSGPNGTPVPLTVPAGTAGTGGALAGYGGELSGWLSASSSGAIVAQPSIPMGGYLGHSVPGAPSILSASTGTFYGAVALTWSAPADDGNSPVINYEVQRSLNTETPEWATVLWPGADATAWEVGGLTQGAGYIFRMRAVNALGAGPYSAPSAPAIAMVQPHVAIPDVLAPDVQFGTDVSITLTVTTAEGDTPTGTTTLTINGVTSDPQPIVGNAVTFTVPELAVGTYPYTLAYANDPRIVGFDRSSSVAVTKADVAVTGALVTAPSPVEGGQYRVTVVQPPGLPAATGDVTVTLTKGSDVVTVPGTLDGGAVTVALPNMAAGTWVSEVAYAGDANYAANTAAGAPVVSTPADVAVTGEVVTAPSPQQVGSYKFTVKQGDGLPEPTGGVTLTLTSESDAEVVVPGTLSGGVDIVELPTLPAGTWAATIAYAGDANYSATTLAGESVISAKSTVAVTGTTGTAPSPQEAGAYEIAVAQPSGLAVATGDVTVTLTSGSEIFSVTDSLSGGAVTVDLPNLAAGTWIASVAYTGDSNYSATTVTGESVVSAKSAVTVSGDVVTAPSPLEGGAYEVTVAQASGLVAATGDVTVTLTSPHGTETIEGTLSGGAVTVDLPSLPAGTWTATITYAGDANYAETTVVGAPVVSTLADVTVTGAVVTASSPQHAGAYEVTVAQPTGFAEATGDVTVVLANGSSTLSVSGVLSAGAVTVELPSLAAGTWTAAVTYEGDSNYAATTADGESVVSVKAAVDAVVGSVTKKPTTTTAGSFKVTVTQPTGLAPATGTATVTLTKGAATKTVSGTLSAGTVTIAVPALAAGTWTASVAYAGDANYATKTVAGASVVVAKGAVSKVTTKVTKVPTTKKAGSYKVTVTQPTGFAKATGKVTVTLKKGKVTKKISGTLKSGAVTIAVPKLAKGIWKASLTYAGDGTYAAKTTAAESVVVGKTKVSKVASMVTTAPTTKKAGSYTVTLTQAKGLPTATGKVTVTLTKGKATKKVTGSLKSGAVTVKVPKLAKGTWKVKIAYAGNATYLKASATGKSVVVK